jgi:hypothetical protein
MTEQLNNYNTIVNLRTIRAAQGEEYSAWQQGRDEQHLQLLRGFLMELIERTNRSIYFNIYRAQVSDFCGIHYGRGIIDMTNYDQVITNPIYATRESEESDDDDIAPPSVVSFAENNSSIASNDYFLPSEVDLTTDSVPSAIHLPK